MSRLPPRVKAPQEPPAHLSVPSDRVGVYLFFWLFLGFAVTFHLWFIASGRLDLAPDEVLGVTGSGDSPHSDRRRIR